MVKYYQLINQFPTPCEEPAADIQIYVNPDDEEKQILDERFQIDIHTLSSALDPDEVSRVEFDENQTTIIWKIPKHYSATESISFGVSSAGFFILRDKLTIISSEDVSLSEIRSFSRLKTPMDSALFIINLSIRHYLEHLKIIKMISHELQVKINTSMENEHLIQMFALSESLIYYLNAISSNGLALHKLRNYAGKLNLSDDTIEFLEDIIIENNQCYRQAEIYSNILSGLMDARGSLVNNNMNMLIKKLTIITVVFMPLNLLASIGGMSEFTMMTEGIPWPVSYSFFLVGMFVIGWITGKLISRMGAPPQRKARRKKKMFKTLKYIPMKS